MNWDEMNKAVEEAKFKLRMLDTFTDQFAELLAGRLRTVRNNRSLRKLKQELAGYNVRTGKWKP